MAPPTDTIPVPTDVAQMYEASNAQTRMNIESMIRVFLSSPSPLPATRTRHEDDLYAWAQEQAGFLRQGAWSALDLEHLSEEIEDVAHSQEDKLISHLLILLTHLLKLTLAAQHLPLDYTRAARGWRLTCRTQRLQIAKVLRRNPRLRPTVPKELQDTYAVARLEAAGALEIEEGAVPTSCPWTADQVLSDTFWPDTPQESQPTDAR